MLVDVYSLEPTITAHLLDNFFPFCLKGVQVSQWARLGTYRRTVRRAAARFAKAEPGVSWTKLGHPLVVFQL